jgi:sulfur-oxidizing protein SoxX
MKTPLRRVATLAVIALLTSCATGPSPQALDAQFNAMMAASFRAEGIAGLDRIQQDADQQACSTGQPVPESLAKQISERALATVQAPADGQYLGDWKEGEKLAQSGRGLTWTDPSAEPKDNGGSCYNCHQISAAEMAHGSIGPSLLHYARTHGVNQPGDPAAQALTRYTWGKLNNAWAYRACSSMPRFGHKGILDPQQIKHLMALLLDPGSPVNAP